MEHSVENGYSVKMGDSVKKLVHSVGHSVKYGSQCKKGHTMKNGLHLKKMGHTVKKCVSV